MVTTMGYQRGAKRVAETYGLLVLELRPPTPRDLDNRLEAIVVTINPVIPVVTEVGIALHLTSCNRIRESSDII